MIAGFSTQLCKGSKVHEIYLELIGFLAQFHLDLFHVMLFCVTFFTIVGS